MSFMNKNINMALIALILIIILVTVGTSVLFQRGLQQRTSEFETTSVNLTECLNQVESFEDALEEQKSELNETSQDIAKYDTLYGQKVKELAKKQEELDATKIALTGMTIQKEQFKEKYSDSLIDINTLQDDLKEQDEYIKSLKQRIEDLKDDLDDCE